MTLTKERIVETIQEKQYITRGRATSIVETTLEIIKDTLARGENILISGFGKFNVRGKKQRKGRNPATGEQLTLRSRRVVTFSPSPVLKRRLNGHHDEE